MTAFPCSILPGLELGQTPLEGILASKLQESRQINHGKIKHDEATHDPKVPPDVGVVHTEPPSELVTSGILAVLTQTTPIEHILDIPTSLGDISARIVLAGLPRRRGEPSKLIGTALHGLVMQRDGQERLEKVVERGEPVHPAAPEVGQLLGGDDDAAEADDEEEEDRHEQAGEQLVGAEGGDGLAEADVVQLEEEDAQQGEAGGEALVRGAPPHDAPPPAVEVDRAREQGPGDLDDDGARGPCEPRVDLCVVLARLEDIAAGQEHGLELLDERRGYGQGHEDGEEAALHVDGAVAQLVEGKTVEQPREDVQDQLAHDVVRLAPVADEGAPDDGVDLCREGHRVLAVVLDVLGVLDVAALLVQLVDLAGLGLELLGRGPRVTPVLTLVVRVARADHVEHPLGWVGVWGTLLPAVGLEVFDECLAVLAQLAGVHDSPPGLEQDELVEVLEEDGGGLVDGAEDGLACVG